MPLAVMLIVNIVNAIQSKPSQIEIAAKGNTSIFVLYVVWLVIAAGITAFLTVLVWRASNRYLDAVKADADARIAEAEERAAEANQKAEEEKLTRVKIEERLADRRLTDEQVAIIVESLKQISGQEFEITAYWDSSETMSIAELYRSPLRS